MDILSIQNFVERYQKTVTDFSNNELASFRNFLEQFKTLENKLSEEMRKSAPYYNIFEILKIRHYEARVHTPFIAHLIDPNGSHNQGRLFFDQFAIQVLDLVSPKGFTDIQVFSERRYSDYGQVDIEIWYKQTNKQKAVFIENKIYHHDGERQLFRYYSYLKSLNISDEDISLLYLTLNGKEPSEQSYSGIPKEVLILKSYYQDVDSWLRVCLDSLPENRVYHIIHQYLNTIHSL
jgi:hypothetical protein